MMDTDDDQDDSPQQYRKLARSTASPKATKANLNAYGVPVNFPTTGLQTKTKSSNDLADRIRVCVRKRPLSKKELRRGETDNTKVTGRRSITIMEPK
jgi:kinesin family protein 2/24